MMVPLRIGTRIAERLSAATGSAIAMATFSPDGKWVAYTSDESGSQQVFVALVS